MGALANRENPHWEGKVIPKSVATAYPDSEILVPIHTTFCLLFICLSDRKGCGQQGGLTSSPILV